MDPSGSRKIIHYGEKKFTTIVTMKMVRPPYVNMKKLKQRTSSIVA